MVRARGVGTGGWIARTWRGWSTQYSVLSTQCAATRGYHVTRKREPETTEQGRVPSAAPRLQRSLRVQGSVCGGVCRETLSATARQPVRQDCERSYRGRTPRATCRE